MNSSIEKWQQIKEFLDHKAQEFNQINYIETDPIQIPHQFSQIENIEISAFLTATIAWGQRKSIIKNALYLMNCMGNNPYDFLMQANKKDIQSINKFKHRTFNSVDLTFFLTALKNLYTHHGGLQKVVKKHFAKNNSIRDVLIGIRHDFITVPHEKRSEKHIANIEKNSAAKRLNMYLRWMIRKDNMSVDFGIWDFIPMNKLYIPLDVHCGNVARKLGLLERKQNDWKAVEELTQILRKFDAHDPVKYDFALFGLGVFEKF